MQSVSAEASLFSALPSGVSLRRSATPLWNDSLVTTKPMSAALDASRILDDGISAPLVPASEHQSMCALCLAPCTQWQHAQFSYLAGSIFLMHSPKETFMDLPFTTERGLAQVRRLHLLSISAQFKRIVWNGITKDGQYT
jgi:hypothetical protein